MRIFGQASIDLGKYRRSIKKRVDKARRTVGKRIAQGISEEVERRIPDDGGWLDIYKDAITFQEQDDGAKVWSVLGEADVELTQVPADKTLAFFEGSGGLAALLMGYNPWPIDTIPAIQNGISANLVLRPASESETTTHRVRHSGLQEAIASALNSLGATILKNERPEINGRIVADLKFLSRRLEHGLGGFPRVPHWVPAKAEAERSGDKWVRDDEDVGKELSDAFRAEDHNERQI